MRIQPVDFISPEEPSRYEPIKPVAKSRFKRLFERQFPGLLRTLSAEKPASSEETICNKDVSDVFEPSSVCLAKMVQNFIEEGEEKHRCCLNLCNCFHRNCLDSDEDAPDSCNCFGDSSNVSSLDACEILKSLVPCVIVSERNLLADTTKIIEKNKMSKRKDNHCRKTIVDSLIALGYDASVCQSRWEKSPRIPAGEYEYIDVIYQGDRLIIDIEFRSEFEIARPTKTYKSILQALPNTYVGKPDRLQKIISIASEAAKQSLKKKGMPVPPWRQHEYVRAKWFSPYTRVDAASGKAPGKEETSLMPKDGGSVCEADLMTASGCELIFGEGSSTVSFSNSLQNGVKKITGLSSLIEEKP
ncbi:unnamed protein product [Cuscuta epithymum]|uniref:DNA-directed RNA polymerase n=1 Tax=Cuscuta epithymum TaxID=186058 RepID=A0AAV0FEU2_9ASTE|nr:unnamed protein product [Cuscuta epithymum]